MLVTNEMAVLNATAGLTPSSPLFNGQYTLEALQTVEEHDAREGESQHTRAVSLPGLFSAGVDTGGTVDQRLDPQVVRP